jgi:hypothetical protein
MKQKTVTVEIDERGNSSIDLEGFQGKGCADVVNAFRSKDLVTKSRTKREFYIEKTAQQGQQLRGAQ